MEEKKGKKILHSIKGPTFLTPKEIQDIVNNRGNTNAVPAMAKKYNISINRVRNIYREYYGGTRLKDYYGGLKKPLPSTKVEVSRITRKAATSTGEYEVDEPETVQFSNIASKPKHRANAKRVIKEKLIDEDEEEEEEAIARKVKADRLDPQSIGMQSLIRTAIESSKAAKRSSKAIAAISGHIINSNQVLEDTYDDSSESQESEDDDNYIDTDDSTAFSGKANTKRSKAATKSSKKSNRHRLEKPSPIPVEYSSSSSSEDYRVEHSDFVSNKSVRVCKQSPRARPVCKVRYRKGEPKGGANKAPEEQDSEQVLSPIHERGDSGRGVGHPPRGGREYRGRKKIVAERKGEHSSRVAPSDRDTSKVGNISSGAVGAPPVLSWVPEMKRPS